MKKILDIIDVVSFLLFNSVVVASLVFVPFDYLFSRYVIDTFDCFFFIFSFYLYLFFQCSLPRLKRLFKKSDDED